MKKKIFCILFLNILVVINCIFIIAQNATAPQRYVPPMLKNGKIAAYITFNRPLVTQALFMNNPAGVTYKEEVYLGSGGVKPASESTEPYLYFQTAKDELVNTTGTFYVSVQYLDIGQSSIELEYFQELHKDQATSVKTEDESPSDVEPANHSQRIFLGNSGFWEEHTFKIENAVFDQLFENKNDIRLFCPDVLIRHISISRIALGKPKSQQTDTFRQAAVSKPPGYAFTVHITNNAAKALNDDPNLLPGTVKLYQSWGATFTAETVDINELYREDKTGETNPIIQRAAALQQHGISWVPRFKIGDINQLPLDQREKLQLAVAAGKNTSGPMVSLWEPGLKSVYTDIFNQLQRKAGIVKIAKIILSFAGDNGPLFLSSEQSGGGLPAYWIADPYATKSIIQYLRLRYGSLGILSSTWGVNLNSWEDAAAFAAANNNPSAKQDLTAWYQQSLLLLADSIIQTVRMIFPQSALEIEIGDQYLYSATDFAGMAAIASRNGCSIVMDISEDVPTQSYPWLLLSTSARRLGVPFGLRIERNPSSSSLLSAVYSLASEGGTILHFNEETIKPKNAWNLFSTSVASLRATSPNKQAAVIFPKTSIAAEDDLIFHRMIKDLRELIAFDVFDESDLGNVNSAQYPIVIIPWGYIWQPQSLERIESIARSGSAVIVKMDEAWITPFGDRSINERIFAGALEMKNGSWTMVPHSETAFPPQTNSKDPADSRSIMVGNPESQSFLSGKWSVPENQVSARRYGLPFESFRWFRERAVSILPVIPNRDYELHIDGFVADQHPVDVYINNTKIGTISGNGVVQWKMPLTGASRPKQSNVQVMLRGQEWNTGTVLGSDKPETVTMAVNRIALLPSGQNSASSQSATEISRQQLRGSHLRELGRGVTLLIPGSRTSSGMLYELIAAISANPKILDARYNFTFPADGEVNRVFVSPQSGLNLYLNLNDSETVLGRKQNLPLIRIPPLSLHYSF